MHSIKVNLEPEVKRQLVSLAKESGELSISQTVNLIILKYLVENKKLTMEQFKEFSEKGRHTWRMKTPDFDSLGCGNGK